MPNARPSRRPHRATARRQAAAVVPARLPSGEPQALLAWWHVVKGEMCVERQESLISRLRASGYDSGMAESLLDTFRGSLAMMREHLQEWENPRGPRS